MTTSPSTDFYNKVCLTIRLICAETLSFAESKAQEFYNKALTTASFLMTSNQITFIATGLLLFKSLLASCPSRLLLSFTPIVLCSFYSLVSSFDLFDCNSLSKTQKVIRESLVKSSMDVDETLDIVSSIMTEVADGMESLHGPFSSDFAERIFPAVQICDEILTFVNAIDSADSDVDLIELRKSIGDLQSIITNINSVYSFPIQIPSILSFNDFPASMELKSLVDFDRDTTNSSLFLVTNGFVQSKSTLLSVSVLLCPEVIPVQLCKSSPAFVFEAISMIDSMLEESQLSDETAYALALLSTAVIEFTKAEAQLILDKLCEMFKNLEWDYAIFKSGTLVLNALAVMILRCVEKSLDLPLELISLLENAKWMRLLDGSLTQILLKAITTRVTLLDDVTNELEDHLKQIFSKFANDDDLEQTRGQFDFLQSYLKIGAEIGFDLEQTESLTVHDNETFASS
ncbi:hypothetical protein GEMRC1_012012 [Eukaryota sp. GEM-RC1]